MAVEASAEPTLDLACVGGRAIRLPGENTEEEPNSVRGQGGAGFDAREHFITRRTHAGSSGTRRSGDKFALVRSGFPLGEGPRGASEARVAAVQPSEAWCAA